MISSSSILSALFVSSILLGMVRALWRSNTFLEKSGASVLLAIIIAATVRLLLPFEIPATYVFDSWTLLGSAYQFVRAHAILVYLVGIAWIVGVAAVIGKEIVRTCRAQGTCRRYVTVDNEPIRRVVERISAPYRVVVSPDVESPYVAGFFRHTIYFPDVEVTEEEIGPILAHEAQHIRTHDGLTKLFFRVVLAAVWWNPVTWFFQPEMNAIIEMCCDATAIKRMSEDERFQYLMAMTSMTKRVVEKRGSPVLNEFRAVSGTAVKSTRKKRKSVMEERFDLVLGTEKRSPQLGIAMKCMLVVLFFASYLVLFQPATAPPAETFEDRAGVYYYENYDDPVVGDGTNSCFILKGSDGRYQLFVDYEFSRYLSEDEANSDEYQHLRLFEESAQK